ncbi:hypothetical protein JCGZ_19674 [Jatropha curcas]|uniref:Uncharacterized protein n=1 Tax=Jatropha curcas TaxID=180498 RepID=A0A067LFL0_JATCU|nr:hypothetical protein JCGZ_19674 [Jatropha curcas]
MCFEYYAYVDGYLEVLVDEKKKSRGFGNYRTSYNDRNVGSSNPNQLGSSNTMGAVNERVRREFTDLGRLLRMVGEVPESEDEQIQLAIQKSLADQEEQWYYSSKEDVNELIKSPEPTFEQLVKGTQFMVSMVQTSSDTEWSKKISEFEDFLGIGDEASRMVQEQKAKARILQSVLAAEDAKEVERKALKMIELEEEKAEATPEAKEDADADKVIQAIKNSCDECIDQAINPVFCFSDFCFENNLDGFPLLFQ